MQLLSPGPVPLPPSVAKALAEPLMHHRSAAFQERLLNTRGLLRRAFGGLDREALILSSSGSGALDAALSNLIAAGDRVVSLISGKFGSRFADYAEGRGAKVQRIRHDPRQMLDLAHLTAALSADTRALLLTATETASGARLDLEAILALCGAYPDLLVMVDGIAWLGCEAFPANLERVDVMLGASQKAFGAPAGLAFAQLSPRAEASLIKRAHYFDFATIAQAQAGNDVAYTMASPLLLALEAGLSWLLGHELAPWAFHARRATLFREACREQGLVFLPALAGNALSVIELAEGQDAERLRKALAEEVGFGVGSGQNEWFGRVLRVGHMGEIPDQTWPVLAAAIAARLR